MGRFNSARDPVGSLQKQSSRQLGGGDQVTNPGLLTVEIGTVVIRRFPETSATIETGT
jgi:hypothetical protein